MKRLIAVGVVVYVVAWFFAWGGMLADLEHRERGYRVTSCRSNLALAVALSIWPTGPIAAPFMTGFYEHGFQWTCPR